MKRRQIVKAGLQPTPGVQRTARPQRAKAGQPRRYFCEISRHSKDSPSTPETERAFIDPCRRVELGRSLETGSQRDEDDDLHTGGTCRACSTRRGVGRGTYFGPGAPAGPRYHHYVFELYALKGMLDLPAGATRAQLLDAMKDIIVGKAAYVGRFRQ